MPVAPTLNLFCNIWHQYALTNPPPIVPPDLANVPCNLQFGRKVPAHTLDAAIWLLLPKLTDIRDPAIGAGLQYDVVEVPAGSKRWYAAGLIDDQAKGFPTETRVAYLGKAYLFASPQAPWLWPVPYP